MLHWSRCLRLLHQPRTPRSCGGRTRSGQGAGWSHRTWGRFMRGCFSMFFLCIVSHNSIFPLPSIHTKALAEINSDSLTCPALVQLQCWRCREPPRSQTRTRPASPGWSSWSSAWPRDPPRQIHTTCTADGEPEISILQISAEFL